MTGSVASKGLLRISHRGGLSEKQKDVEAGGNTRESSRWIDAEVHCVDAVDVTSTISVVQVDLRKSFKHLKQRLL